MNHHRSEPLFLGPIIAVTVEAVRRWGPTKALALQQLHFWSDPETGWARGTYEDWAQATGLSRSQVKHVLLALRKDELIEARTAETRGFDRTIEYRLTVESSTLDRSDPPESTRSDPPDVPISLEGIKESSLTRARVRETGPSFADFWAAYPRKTAKGAAETAWAKAIKLATGDVIIAGALRFAADPNRVAEFTPHPATWLNQKRWDDEPLPTRSTGRVPAKAKPLLSDRTAKPTAKVITDGSDW